jgi:hypothetical protein
MGRAIQWGDNVVQRDDGSWQTDYAMDVHDQEVLPQTIQELHQHLLRFSDPVPAARAIARAADHGVNLLARAKGIAQALLVSGNPAVVALRATRRLRANNAP